ncbi:MAG: beta-lactamase class [Sphingomonadales bacterium]|jgi:beta-lactamase class A|nr:beta-lactamase class [Sphingomonadales bacterium]
MIDRRTFIAAALAAGACARTAPADPGADATADGSRFEAIRATLGPGGRLGVAAIDIASGRELRFDGDARYAMASTFKLPLAAAVLSLIENGKLAVDEELRFSRADLVDNSPTIEANLARGRLPVWQLCAAIVEVSDNSAANLLLRRIGGPAAVTRFVRACGDPVTRLDRFEMELNSNRPGDPRDTTSPAAMAGLVRKLVLGDVLTQENRNRLSLWLKKSVPGSDRLRAGFPVPPWLVGHKTGTGANGAVNDVAIAWRSGKPPVVVACYQSGGTAEPPVRFAAHAAVARVVAERFG